MNSTKRLKAGEVAKILGVTTKTISLWNKKGKLIGHKDENGYIHYDQDEVLKLKALRMESLGNGIPFTAGSVTGEPLYYLSTYIGNTIDTALGNAIVDVSNTLGNTLSPALKEIITTTLTEIMSGVTSVVIGNALGNAVPHRVIPDNTQEEKLSSDNVNEVEQLVMQLKKLLKYREVFRQSGLEVDDILPFLQCLKNNIDCEVEEQRSLNDDKRIEELKAKLADMKKGEPVQIFNFNDDDFDDL